MIQLFTKHEPLKERLGKIELLFSYVEDVDNLFSDEIIISDPETARELIKKRDNIILLVLSDTPSLEEGTSLLALGIKGYGNSYMFSKHFEQAITVLEAGNVWLYPSFMQEMISSINSINEDHTTILEKLTDRESEIALHVSKGASNKEIAIALEITERTVKQHISHIFEKLNVSDRLSLALLLK
jgi:DNA-binding NarL/FixJ family response regulator